MYDYPSGSVWPADDSHAVEVREVYARYGLAMYLAQVLEHAIVNTLLVFRFIPTRGEYPDKEAWEHAFDRFFDAEFGKTFGNMLNALDLIADLPPDLMRRLRSAKADRDHLAHRFFREHDTDFMTSNGRMKMIAECERLIDCFQELDHELEAFAASQSEHFGITREMIEKEFARLMSELSRA